MCREEEDEVEEGAVCATHRCYAYPHRWEPRAAKRGHEKKGSMNKHMKTSKEKKKKNRNERLRKKEEIWGGGREGEGHYMCVGYVSLVVAVVVISGVTPLRLHTGNTTMCARTSS